MYIVSVEYSFFFLLFNFLLVAVFVIIIIYAAVIVFAIVIDIVNSATIFVVSDVRVESLSAII